MTAPAPSRPLAGYRRRRPAVRAHVALRWATGPFGALDPLVPAEGRILDWGCGHGVGSLALARAAPGRTVVGCDIDAAKLVEARAAAAELGLDERARFEEVAPDDLPVGPWDAIVADDVLYLLDEPARLRLLDACAAAVAPGGVVVCKEMGRRPRWKWTLTRAQERVVVSLLGLTATAAGLQPFPDPEVVAARLGAAGLAASVLAIDRGYHVPHVAVVGRRAP